MITDYLLAMHTGILAICGTDGVKTRSGQVRLLRLPFIKKHLPQKLTALTTAYNYVEKLLLHRM